jgi:hypothetical protein
MKPLLLILLPLLSTGVNTGANDASALKRAADASLYSKWENGPPGDPDFFPIGVWLQDPKDARAYKAAGINLYVGLWKGPTIEQVNHLKIARMPVICEQNDLGLRAKDEKIILGWLAQPDEPDNAQPLTIGVGHGPPIAPAQVVKEYETLRRLDPSRPVLLNLGQGVAWDGWWGRGNRSGHPEDYPEYIKGCDIASFDIYPVAHSHANVAGKLEVVAQGVSRLIAGADPPKVVWNCIETTGVHTGHKPTPRQVKAEVWMSLIHGSRGIIYFVHEWAPRFSSRALLTDPEMLASVTAINAQIRELAPVLNSPTLAGEVEVASSNSEIPIATMMKRLDSTLYLFTVSMRQGKTHAAFSLHNPSARAAVKVLGEARNLEEAGGHFEDDFENYEVHLYRIGP